MPHDHDAAHGLAAVEVQPTAAKGRPLLHSSHIPNPEGNTVAGGDHRLFDLLQRLHGGPLGPDKPTAADNKLHSPALDRLGSNVDVGISHR